MFPFSQRSRKTDAVEKSLTERTIGTTVTINGVGGSIAIGVGDNPMAVSTNFRKATPFVVELAPPQSATGPPRVTFRVPNTHKYLTVSMYGDKMKQATAEALARSSPLLPEIIPCITEFLVDDATKDTNFEGAGFNYQPMTLQDGPPNMLQIFELEEQPIVGHQRERVGVRTLFGTYWRSQHWDKVVSQSAHCLGDETWELIPKVL